MSYEDFCELSLLLAAKVFVGFVVIDKDNTLTNG